ncbi:MAG TPA: PKD domain-containing protein, partial [Cyclobacteriaceae bacterium]
FTEKRPIAYQVINGNQVYVKCEYKLCDNQLSFVFPDGYDQCYELIIDPLLIFSTYSGSTADNWGSTATPGENGNLYSAGVTNRFVGDRFSGDFPVTSGAFQTTYGGLYDVGLLKYDSTGQHLLYASYLGGSDNESAHSLVMNANQELIILGTTGSSDFPTSTNAFSKIFKGGRPEVNVVNYDFGTDLFVARISKDGSQLISSTYLGGSANDGLNPTRGILAANYGDELRGDVITDAQGNIYISSVTSSGDFPVVNGFNTIYKGGDTDALLLKLDPSLTSVLWGSFLGGVASDASHTIKFDKINDLYVGGGTASPDFPITAGTYQSVFGGSVDGWIAKIANDGSAVMASTFTGTAAFNQVYFLDLNKDDEVYVYGQTVGAFPVTSGAYHNANSGQFVQKFNPALNQLIFSTVFGSGRGIPDISPTAFIVNDCNNIFMTGWGGIVNQFEGYWNNNTVGMPLTDDAFQKTTSGSDFYFMVLTDDAKEFLYGTYMGGKSSRTHVDGGTSRFDKKGVVYHAVCSGCAAFNAMGQATSDFPMTANAWSTKNKSLNCNNAAFKFDLSSLKARIQTNSVKLNMPGLNKVCFPDSIVFQNKSTGGEIYEWDFGDNTQKVVTDTAGIVHQYKKAGKYTVKMKAIDEGTCVGKDSTATTVTVFERLGVAGPDGTMCTDSSFKLTASNGIAYVWTGIKNDFKSTAQNPIVSPKEESDYQVTITDFQGCAVTDTVNVKVVPGINLVFESHQKFNCGIRPELVVTNLTDEKEETFWDFGDGTTSDLRNEKHIYQKDSLYSVRLIGKKEFCVYDTLMKVPVFTFFTPNVITPDQSIGENDTFQVLYGGRTPSEMNAVVSLIVYNRWGHKVFESQHYKNDWSGNDLSNGVYYYEADVENDATCRGWVQIIR